MNAVDSRCGKIWNKIVQQAQGAQCVPDAIKRIRTDILDQISLEIQSRERLETFESLSTGSAGELANAVLREIEKS